MFFYEWEIQILLIEPLFNRYSMTKRMLESSLASSEIVFECKHVDLYEFTLSLTLRRAH